MATPAPVAPPPMMTTSQAPACVSKRRRISSRVMRSPDVPVGSHAFAAVAVSFGRHGVDAAAVDPAIVEIEKGAYGNGVVDGFVVPAGTVEDLYIGIDDVPGLGIHLLDEAEERL